MYLQRILCHQLNDQNIPRKAQLEIPCRCKNQNLKREGFLEHLKNPKFILIIEALQFSEDVSGATHL